MPGKVYLVGAGPGDPELLTLKALRVLKSADVVLHDALIGTEVLQYIPRRAKVQDVGKRCGQKSVPQPEINRLLVNYARLDLQVVRLKGGDPLIFGRSGEEIEALRQANIDFEIVPGITAALASAAAANFPLTHREVSSATIFLTSHRSKSSPRSKSHADESWPAELPSNATVVVYMPGRDYARTAEKLRQSGVKGATPCVVISQAASQNERVYKTTVDALPAAPQLPAPSLLVVGEVTRLAEHASLRPSAFAVSEEVSALFAQLGDLSGDFASRHFVDQEQPE